MQIKTITTLGGLGMLASLGLSACLGAPASTGLKQLPPAGMYSGTVNSTMNESQGLIFGFLSNQSSFGQPILQATLAMNFNNSQLGLFSDSIALTTDQSVSCLSGADTISTNPTSLTTTSGVISFTNCQVSGNQFSANYVIYKQSSGVKLDSGSLSMSLNSNCQLYPSAVTTLPSGSYSGGMQSCLNPAESSALSGSVSNSNIRFSETFESEVALMVGTANNDYSTSLTESVTAGTYAGYITPVVISNINRNESSLSANYVSYYDYGIFQATVN